MDLATPQSGKSITLQNVADHCQVSRALVSRVLRGDVRFASAATAERIRVAARELGYDPGRHLAARRLVSNRTSTQVINHVIALYFPARFYGSHYFTWLYEGIMEELSAARYSALMDYSTTDGSDALHSIFCRGDVDGAIVISNTEAFLPQLRRLRDEPNFGDRPIVSLMEQVPGCSFLGTDDCHGGYLAAHHLLELGHRRIFYQITPKYSYPHAMRMEGYRRACLYHGYSPEEILLPIPYDSRSQAQSEAVLLATLEQHPEGTAFLAMNDGVAMLLRDMLQRAGRRVPEDYSLVGYDDSGDAGADRLLTTIRLPFREIGRRAAAFCIQRITGDAPADTTLIFPVELVVRSSTAAV